MKRKRLLAAALAACTLGVQVVALTGAFSQKVANPPGPFVYTIHNASIRINDQSFDFDDQHTPQCSDGENNDKDFLGSSSQQDSAIDYPADPQCTSPSDDSEVVAGFQPVLPVTVTGTIGADGAWSVSAPAGVFFPPGYAYAVNPANGSAFTVTIQITGRPSSGTWIGNLNPLTGQSNLAMQLRVSITGGPITATCHIGDDTGTDRLIAQANSATPGGVPYNATTGSLTMSDQNFRVPPAKDCGTIVIVDIADQINSSFGIPTTNTNAIFTGDFPAANKPLRAIVPSLNVAAGVACRTTSFTTTGTTSSRPVASYGFDDTNDGTFEQSTATNNRSVTFATAGARTARLRVTDDQGDFAETTANYTVGANLPPTAPNQNLPRSGAGLPVNFTLGGSDPEGGPVTRSIIVSPLNGTVTGTSPNFTYTPNAGFGGVDVLTYKVVDDCADSSDTSGTVQFNINRIPTADNQTVNTNQEVPVNFTLTGTDADGDSLTFSLASSPAHGTITGTPPNLQYTPEVDFNGTDSLTFNVNDGLNGSVTPGTITFNVTKNARPVATSQIVTTPEDTDRGITLSGTDADGDALAFTVTSSTTHGTLSGSAPNLTYHPAPNFHGTDSFVFQVDDGKGGIASATVTINVTSVNDEPVATDQSFNLQHDTTKSFTLNVHDDDGDALSFTPVTSVAHGVLTGSFPNFTYVPNSGYIGPDTLFYRVTDGNGGAATATVHFNVTATNQPPVAGSAIVNTNEDTSRTIILDASDPEGGDISITVGTPAHGQLTGIAPILTYTPDAEYNGPDSFTFSVTDDLDQTSTGTISINVLAVNDTPVAIDQTINATEDTAQSVILSANDPDDASITFNVTGLPAHGTVTGSGANVTYVPDANFNGTDSFTFRARDPQGAMSTGTITLIVGAVNDPPKATTSSRSVAEDNSVAVPLTGSDVDGDPLTFIIVSAPAHGSLSGAPPSLTYQPLANYNGFDSFTYKVNDGFADSAIATVTIAITAVNDTPVPAAQPVLHVIEDSSRTVTLSATDADGDTIKYKVEVAPVHGTLSGTAPNLTYKPFANYNGADTFKFSVTDPKGAKANGVIDLLVDPLPLIPTTMTAAPIVANLQSGKWYYPRLKATLTRNDTKKPLVGRTVAFYANDVKLCQAVTNSSGVATCGGSSNSAIKAGSYVAKFGGDYDFAASQATGKVT